MDTTLKHFVLVRLSALGDVTLTTGVLQYLHKEYGYTFSILTREAFAPLFYNAEGIVAIHSFPHTFSLLYLIQQSRILAMLYPHSPLIDVHGTLRTKILSFFWKSAVYTYPKFRVERRQYLRNRNPSAKTVLLETNITQRYFLAFKEILALEGVHNMPSVEELAPRIVLEYAQEQNVCTKYSLPKEYIVLHPYATHATKMWPEAYWEELIDILQDKGYTICIVGRSVKVFSTKAIPIEYNFTNRTTLEETFVLVKNAFLNISGDSGIVHIATAVNTPSIVLFGATTKEWGFFPPKPSIVLEDATLYCRPCSLHGGKKCPFHLECMMNIEPKIVADAVETFHKRVKL